MKVPNRYALIVVAVAVVSLALAWMPFLTKTKNVLGVDFDGATMSRIVQNFDGLNFLVVAKTWYNPGNIADNYPDILVGRKPLYFSAHYPGLPAIIAIFDIFLSGPNSLLLAIIVSNILLGYGLYAFFLIFTNKPKVAVWLAIIALFFPARMLADRMAGSNEPLFMFFVLMSLVTAAKGKAWWSGILGAFAVLTRSPGIILYGAYMIQIWFMTNDGVSQKVKKSIPYLLIPLSLLSLWIFYGMQFGSFLAYFQVGGNINLYWPFAVFASHMDWVSGIWNEDLVYLFVLLITGLILFWKKNKNSPAAIYGLLYGVFVICVAHRDLARYSLPVVPMALLGITPILENKVVKIAAAILLIPIFLYAWQFVLANYQPVMNWTNYL